LLDLKSMGMLAAMASSNDWQIWMKSQMRRAKSGFVIVDGEVAMHDLDLTTDCSGTFALAVIDGLNPKRCFPR